MRYNYFEVLMEKEINIKFLAESDIIEKYNDDKLSKDLLEYIISEAEFTKRNENIKIIIDNRCQTKLNYKDMLYNAFNEEYIHNLKEHLKNNILQLIFLLVGIFFIFLSFKVDNQIWKEIFLIGGWVPIWEMIDLELFNDIRGIKRKKNTFKIN